MNKKIIYGIVVAIIFIIGLSSLLQKYPLNTNISGDPFGTPPIGISPNCGPEDRYKFDEKIKSPSDLVSFLAKSQGKLLDSYKNDYFLLDNFKENGVVNWSKVLEKVKVEKIGSRTIYSLAYTPLSICSPAQEWTVKTTDDGHVSLYGCCGK